MIITGQSTDSGQSGCDTFETDNSLVNDSNPILIARSSGGGGGRA